MGRLQRYAEGFLSLVGNKVGGREPTQLSDVVIPSVDMTQLLLGRTYATEGGVSLNSNITDSISLIVPDNEVWLMNQMSVELTRNGAGGNRYAVKGYLTKLPQSSAAVNEIVLLPSVAPYTGLSGTGEVAYTQHFDTPFVLTAGVEIKFEVVETNIANAPWSGKVGFYRLDA